MPQQIHSFLIVWVDSSITCCIDISFINCWITKLNSFTLYCISKFIPYLLYLQITSLLECLGRLIQYLLGFEVSFITCCIGRLLLYLNVLGVSFVTFVVMADYFFVGFLKRKERKWLFFLEFTSKTFKTINTRTTSKTSIENEHERNFGNKHLVAVQWWLSYW